MFTSDGGGIRNIQDGDIIGYGWSYRGTASIIGGSLNIYTTQKPNYSLSFLGWEYNNNNNVIINPPDGVSVFRSYLFSRKIILLNLRSCSM